MDLVVHLDELGCGPGLLFGLGHHHGEDVPGVRGALADGNHDRPVGNDDADPHGGRDVGRREHGDHTVGTECVGGVDRQDVGPGVCRQVQRGVEHARHPDVVDVAAIAQRERRRLVLGARGTDAALGRRDRLLALRHGLDGVEHFHVARATAQVCAEVAFHVLTLEAGALLVDLGLGPHHDAGDAVTALQTAAGGEGVGVRVALFGREALEGGHRTALDLGHGVGARDLDLAVDHHRAAAALTRRRAAVLGRGDVELLAERSEQMGMVGADADLPPVELEGHGGGRDGRHGRHLYILSTAGPRNTPGVEQPRELPARRPAPLWRRAAKRARRAPRPHRSGRRDALA